LPVSAGQKAWDAQRGRQDDNCADPRHADRADRGIRDGGGHPVEPRRSAEIRQRISVMPEAPGLYRRLTVTENLEFFARPYGLPRREERMKAALAAPASARSSRNGRQPLRRRLDLQLGQPDRMADHRRDRGRASRAVCIDWHIHSRFRPPSRISAAIAAQPCRTPGSYTRKEASLPSMSD
jgi:hypothetical protein